MKSLQSFFAASLLLAVAAAGCATTTDIVDIHNNKAIVGVEINPSKDTLAAGTSLQFRAVVQYADGTDRDVTRVPDTVWNTSNARIATVSDGLVTALKVGLVDISAEYQGVKANEHFAVTP
jgi:uncharacterized protein YjdB